MKTLSHDPGPHLSVIIPAFNEEDGIEATVTELRAKLPSCEVIVVDDGSGDRTAERAARNPGVRVVRHEYNAGYGASVKTGVRLARGEYVAWFDADNQHRVEDLLAMVDRLDTERLVAVIAQRRTQSGAPIRQLGKLAILALSWALKIRAGPDLNCGLRVFRRRVILRYLSLLPDGFSASLTSTMIMVERRYPIAFQPVSVRPRIGESKVRLSDGFGTLMLVVRVIMLFAPLRIFLRLGVVLSLAGLSYGLIVSIRNGLGVPAAAVLITLAGLMLCMLGLIADQISHLRLERLGATSAAVFAEESDQAESTAPHV